MTPQKWERERDEMNIRTSILALIAVGMLAFVPAAHASTIDLLTGADTTIDDGFGAPDTSLFAQSVIADAGTLTGILLSLQSSYGDDFVYLVHVVGSRLNDGSGLGYDPDMADILWSSSVETVPANATSFFDVFFSVNVPVTVGETYWIVLDTLTPYAGSDGNATLPGWSSDEYGDGEFVYMNAGEYGLQSVADANDYTWDRWPYAADMGLRVTFGDGPIVPEPATVSLLALGIAAFVVRRGAFRRLI